jgi:excisionase family DNA binding protein
VTKLLTRDEVAQILSMSVRSVDRMKATGVLPAVKLLRSVRFRLEDVEALLKSDQGGTTTPRRLPL